VAASVAVLNVPEWNDLPWLVHGFSTRAGGRTTAYGRTGDLNLGFTEEDDRASVIGNRELLLEQLGSGDHGSSLALVRQVHSSITHRVRQLPQGQPRDGDGLITDTPGLWLGILTADCVPVLVVDRRCRAVGAFHAGWRGTLARIVEAGVQKMRDEFGSHPADLSAAIGPAIGACCYTVGEAVRQPFQAQFGYADELFSGGDEKEALRLDLAEANRGQLQAAGIANQAITRMGTCTSCDTNRFFSHRGEHGKTGRMMAVIGIQPKEA
jgi:YfiH family protein